MEITSAPSTALPNPLTSRLLLTAAVTDSSSPFTTRANKPNVSTDNGKVTRCSNGPSTACTEAEQQGHTQVRDESPGYVDPGDNRGG